MSRKNKPLPILNNVTIEAVAAEGKSLFHWTSPNQTSPNPSEGGEKKPMVVFVPFCVPGDVVDVRLTRKKHSFAEGEVIKIITPSPLRTEPKCKHFGVCGGCKWQNMPYEEQLKFKHQQVFDQLTRIGKVELPEFNEIMGSVKQFEYRNKLDFGCSNKQWLTREQMQQGIPFEPGIGFHISGAFDKILPIDKCWLMDDLNNRVRNYIYKYARNLSPALPRREGAADAEGEAGNMFYDLRAQHGLLRDLVMRNSLSGEFMLVVQFGPKEPIANNKEAVAEEIRTMSQFDEENAMKVLEAIHVEFPEITSLLWVYNPKCNDTFGDLEVHNYYGTDFIYELMEDLKFKVGPKSFYQTNTEQALHLYEVAREFAFGVETPKNEESESAEDEKPVVYDLYTGTGTIANFVAKKAKKVVGIEYVPEAIEDAKVNSQINGIDNTEFFAGDMKDILTEEFVKKHGRPDTIITDPPRAGMHPDVINVILGAAPKRIVYVSCNPATQARDLQLMDAAYKVVAVQPVDMFPHTPHVENVVLLVKR